MARVEVEARMAAVLRRLEKVQKAVKDPDPILDDIGDVLRKGMISRFYSQVSPTGKRWKPSKAARRARRRTLVDTAALRDRLEVTGQDGKLFVGTDVWYGRLHQEGGKIDATYRPKRRSGRRGGKSKRGGGWTIKSITTSSGRSRKIRSFTRIRGGSAFEFVRGLSTLAGRKRKIKSVAWSLHFPGKKTKGQQVRLPPRRFLGASKRDRSRMTKILMDKLNEAVQ